MTDDMILVSIGGIFFLGIVGALTAAYIYSQKHKVQEDEEEVRPQKKKRWGCLPLAIVLIYAAFKIFIGGDDNHDAISLPEGETASFTGVSFGSNIEEMTKNIKLLDGSNERGLLNYHGMSHKEAEYRPDNPFRGFKVGTVRASWSSSKIYEIEYKCEFSRTGGSSTDDIEIQETINALSKKYSQEPEEKSDTIWGDKTYVFKANDLVVTLKKTVEGLLANAGMTLMARDMKFYEIAEQESQEYVEKVRKSEQEKIKSGGEDAL